MNRFYESRILPFLLAFGGVILDYVTTRIGVNMGFHEVHPHYSPFWALLYFLGAVTILTFALPRKKPWIYSIIGLALLSYLGFFNNILVILGVFPGLGF